MAGSAHPRLCRITKTNQENGRRGGAHGGRGHNPGRDDGLSQDARGYNRGTRDREPAVAGSVRIDLESAEGSGVRRRSY